MGKVATSVAELMTRYWALPTERSKSQVQPLVKTLLYLPLTRKEDRHST